MKIPKIFFISLFLLTNLHSEEINFDIKSAINFAVKKNENIQIKNLEIKNFEYKYKEVRTDIYPQISANVNYTNYLQYPTKTDFEKNIALNLTQLIYSFGKVESAIKIAQNYKELSQIDKKQTELELIHNVKIAYLNVILNKKIVEIHQESLNNAKTNKDILVENFAQGRLKQTDVLKMDSDIATRIVALKNAEINLEISQKYLKRLLNIPDDVEINFIEDFINDFTNTNLDFDQLSTEIMTSNPLILAINQNIAVNKNLAQLEKANYYPTMSAFASYSKFAGDNDMFTNPDKFKDLSYVGINIALPIYDAKKYTYRKLQALENINKNEIMLHKTKKDLELALNNQIFKYTALIEILEADKTELELAEKSFVLFQDRFRAGNLTSMDLNDANLMVLSANINLVMTLYNINIALTEIEYLRGFSNYGF